MKIDKGNLSSALAVLSVLTTLLTAIAAGAQQLNWKYAGPVVVVSGILSAFTRRIHYVFRRPRAAEKEKKEKCGEHSEKRF